MTPLVAFVRRDGVLVAVPPVSGPCDTCPTGLDACNWFGCTRDMSLEAVPEEVA